MTSPDSGRVDRRYAQAYVAELLAGLDVVQDDSTAAGVLDATVAVERKRTREHGEVLVLTFQIGS